MTTAVLTKPAPESAPSHRWNMASIAIIAFAVGAALTNFLMRNVFERPLRVGATEFRYFSDEEVSRAFQKQFAARREAQGGAKWMGFETSQNPLDMWVAQEIITEVKPDVVIETGTGQGGSALAFATFLDQLHRGKVLTIDRQPVPNRPAHERIAYHTGSSTDPAVFAKVRSQIDKDSRVMVVLDSSHEESHVSRELNLYAPLVGVGSYIVVHNTQLNGHPLELTSQLRVGVEGPYEAVEDFLRSNPNFVADKSRERFGVTDNPMGWLKRVR